MRVPRSSSIQWPALAALMRARGVVSFADFAGPLSPVTVKER